ncbi:MAG: type VII toxin-antitoxin system HepT family RNase toxin [Solirubrobacteraceae bacterium]
MRARLARLEELIESLEDVRAEGLSTYLADKRLRGSTERWLQLAEQVCIDVGAHMVSDLSTRTPSDYAGIFKSLADAGHLDRELASPLAQAARQRNLLVHDYVVVDDQKVFESLEHLDDLRAFASEVQRLLDAPETPHGAE